MMEEDNSGSPAGDSSPGPSSTIRPQFNIEFGKGVPPNNYAVAFASSDAAGNPGQLNLYVLNAFGYSENDIPKSDDLKNGFALLTDDGQSPIIFVVTVSDKRYQDSATMLKKNLTQALETYRDLFESQEVWIPFMGTGVGNLTYVQSFEASIAAFAQSGLLETGMPAKIVFSAAPDIDEETWIDLQNNAPDVISKYQPDWPPVTERINSRMLSDGPIGRADDQLDFGAYADALANLIDNPKTSTPLTLAINAPWGAGKSSLGKMIQEKLAESPATGGRFPHVTFWFNAWMHDEADNLATAFVGELAREADRLRPRWRRWVNPLPVNLRLPGDRIRYRLILGGFAVLMALFVAVLSFIFLPEELLKSAFKLEDKQKLNLASGSLAGVVFVVVTIFLKIVRHFREAAKAVAGYVSNPSAEAGSGSLEAVRQQLYKLIDQALPRGSRVVVFVDDLERCRPPGSVNLLEVVNQLLSRSPIVTVIMADLTSIAAAAEVKYANLAKYYFPAGVGPGSKANKIGAFGRLFLQKIIQLQFDLPDQPKEKVERLISATVDPQTRTSEEDGIASIMTLSAERMIQKVIDIWVFSWFQIAWEAGSPTASYFRLSNVRTRVLRPIVTFASLFWLPALWITRFGLSFTYPRWRRQWVSWRPMTKIFSRVHASFVAFNNLCGVGWLVFVVYATNLTIIGSDEIRVWRSQVLDFLAPRFGTETTIYKSYVQIWQQIGTWWDGENPMVNISPTISFDAFDLLFLTAFLLIGTVALAALQFLITIAYGIFRRFIDHRELEKLHDLLDQHLESKKFGSGLPQGVDKTFSGDRELLTKIFGQRQQLRLVNDSEQFIKARETALAFLYLRPRSVKRLVNRLRLLISILADRGLLDGDGMVAPEAIGKWVAFHERWPEIANVVVTNVDLMRDLEIAADSTLPRDKTPDFTVFNDLVQQHTPSVSGDRDLVEFLIAEPALSPMVYPLVYMQRKPNEVNDVAVV